MGIQKVGWIYELQQMQKAELYKVKWDRQDTSEYWFVEG